MEKCRSQRDLFALYLSYTNLSIQKEGTYYDKRSNPFRQHFQ